MIIFKNIFLSSWILLIHIFLGEKIQLIQAEVALDENVNPNRYGDDAPIVLTYLEPKSRDMPSNPLFYGFFYGYNTSNSLRLITEKYLAFIYDSVPSFASFLDKAMMERNVSDPFGYYQKPVDPETGRVDPYFHTTANFCGRKNCSEYWSKAGKFLGKPFEMHLVGLFFTNRTYGIRVKLTTEEQNIFDGDERTNTIQAVPETETLKSLRSRNMTEKEHSVNEVSGHEYEGYYHSKRRGKEKTESHPLYPGIHFYPQGKDFHPTESRAHITIGCAPGVDAVQTGLDLLEIIDLEISGYVSHKDIDISGGDLPAFTLRNYGYGESNNEVDDSNESDQLFVIYPSEKMVTDATFSVYL